MNLLSGQSKFMAFKGTILLRSLQFLICSIGISFFAWAYISPRFRDAEGFLDGGFCLPIAVGIALIVLGLTITGQLRKTAFWFALALVGQAVALQMIEAGPFIRYQHYKPFGCLLTETHLPLLIYFSVQTVLVVAGFRTRWTEIRAWLGRTFKPWQLTGIGLVLFLSSATVSRQIPVYIAELFFAAFVQAVNLGNIVLIVWALPSESLASWRQRLERLLGLSVRKNVGDPGGLDRFAILAAIWITVLAALLSVFVYERHPHIDDEVMHLYQARYFAEGALTVPAPPVPEAFSVYLIAYQEDRWYSPVPPGWPAVLALGVLFGVPWLVNPVLAGLNVLLVYILLQEIYARRTARMAVLLLCISPWHIFMAMNFMNHTFTLTCALIASVAIARARRTGKIIWGIVGGIAVGMVSLIRPLDGVIVGGLLGLRAVGIGGRRLKVPCIAAFALCAILVGAVVLPYNEQITGHPTVFPLMAYFEKYFGPKTNALGFGPERGLGWPIDPLPGHSPLEALINANLNTFSINIELFGWSIGSLVIVALLLFSGAMRRNDYLMLAVIIIIFAVYSLYWFSGGPDFGARYWYLMLIPLVALTVRGIQFLERVLRAAPACDTDRSTRVIIGVLALCLLTLMNYFPWRAIDKYHHYRGMRPDIRYLAKRYNFGKSLVLIRGNEPPDYMSAWTYNPLQPYADMPIYAWDRDPEIRVQLLKAYSDRPVWTVDGPSMTHGGFKVTEGPLPAHKLIQEKGK